MTVIYGDEMGRWDGKKGGGWCPHPRNWENGGAIDRTIEAKSRISSNECITLNASVLNLPLFDS